MTDNRTTERVDHPPRVREAIDELMREKDATDNRTTELLRKLLDERGVKWWETINHANCIFTWWESPTFGTVQAMDNEDGETLFMACLNDCDFTPEQAIAATLGSNRENRLGKLVRIYGEIANYFCERFACCDAEFANCKYCIGLPQGGQCELGWCNDESKALGIEQPDYGGAMCEPVNLQELYDKLGERESYSRWHELFGTPERAARTLAGITCDDGGCEGCTLYGANCSYDSDALLEWLRGDK